MFDERHPIHPVLYSCLQMSLVSTWQIQTGRDMVISLISRKILLAPGGCIPSSEPTGMTPLQELTSPSIHKKGISAQAFDPSHQTEGRTRVPFAFLLGDIGGRSMISRGPGSEIVDKVRHPSLWAL